MSDNIPVPTVELLVKELKEVTDWRLFGVSLGIPFRKLDTIKLDDPNGGVEIWKMKMFHFWLRLRPDASWKDVVQALEQNDYVMLAARVKRTYTLGKSAEEKEFETEILADACVVRQLRDLETSFGLMLGKYGSILKDCDDELSEAKKFLNRVCGPEFNNCKNIDELLDQLCQENHIDTFNLYRLKSLLEIFESKREALWKVIEEYEEKKENFLQSTTVSQFQRAIVEKVEPVLQKGKVLVTIKVPTEVRSNLILRDIEFLALNGFEDFQKYLIRVHACAEGSITHVGFKQQMQQKMATEVTLGGKIVNPQEEVVTMADRLQSEPTIPDLLNRVSTRASDKWELIGLQLGIEGHEIKSIAKEFMRDTYLCHEQVFRKWQKGQSPPYTWATIINVLKSRVVNEKRLAFELENWLKSN